MKSWIKLLILLPFVLATQAHADGGASTADVEALLQALHSRQNYETIIQRTQQVLKQNMPAGGEQQAAMFDSLFKDYLSYDTVKGNMVQAYKETYTADEIKQLTVFFNTPAGQKYVEKAPDLAYRMQTLMMQQLGPHLQEMAQRLKAAQPEQDSDQPPAPKNP